MTHNQTNIFVYGNNTIDLISVINGFISASLSGVRIVRNIKEIERVSDIPKHSILIYIPTSFDQEEYLRLSSINGLNIYTVSNDQFSNVPIDINQYTVSELITKIENGAFNYNSLSQGYFLIKINNKLKRVEFDEIDYFESDGKYLYIHTGDRKYISRSSIKDILSKLPSYFLRVHLSFIVNLRNIKHLNIKDNKIQLSVDQVPFSRKYKPDLMSCFEIL